MLDFVRRAFNPSVSQGELERTWWNFGLDGSKPVIAHSSLSSLGSVVGGALSVVRSLQRYSSTLVMPAFTYYTLVWPQQKRNADWPPHTGEDGPPFRADSPVSKDIGRIPQTLLERPEKRRSSHPALSFVASGQEADMILGVQTLEHPYAPIGVLAELDAWVLLLGVDHRSNTSVHYGEYLAGRPMLERWVNTSEGAMQTYYPNCSAGFNAIESRLTSLRTLEVGKATVQVMKVREVIEVTRSMIARHPEALLCAYPNCRCQNVRNKIKHEGIQPRRDVHLEMWLGQTNAVGAQARESSSPAVPSTVP
jgi:aminoglycoside 3-N-acetyltransferase